MKHTSWKFPGESDHPAGLPYSWRSPLLIIALMFSEVVDLAYPISLAIFSRLRLPLPHISTIFARAILSWDSFVFWTFGLSGTWALWPLGSWAIWTLGTISCASIGPFVSLGPLGGRAIMSKISLHFGHAALIINFDAASFRLSP